MNAVDKGLYAALTGDSTLTGLLSGTAAIYQGRAPDGAQTPYIVYSKVTGRPSFTFTQKAWDEPLYAVKAVDERNSAARAGTIAARIETVLTDAALSVSGRTTLYCRPETDIDYPEVDQGRVTWHRGHTYRVFVS